MAIYIGGGNEYVAMRNLPLMLQGLARAWLNSLPTDRVYEYIQRWTYKEGFPQELLGTYKRPRSVKDLRMCVQRKGEPFQAYIQRWTHLRNCVKNVPEDQAINAFQHGVWYDLLRHKLPQSNISSMGQLMEIANKYATGEESLQYEVRATKGKANADFPGPKQQSDLGH